jgi:hypothetical protein
MASYNKFQDYVDQLNRAVHNWASHTFHVTLSNVAPAAGNALLSDITQIANGGGFTGGAGGGFALDTVSLSESGGTAKVTIADEVFTASAAVATFRYTPFFNNTATNDPLICWYDYGSGVTLATSETFTWDFDPTNGLWQMV